MSARPASQLTPRPIAWLWSGRLALGYLTLFDGNSGMGKSWVALDLCARLSKGKEWPDGSRVGDAANSLVLSSEDNDAEGLLPRLQALEADLSRVYLWDSEKPFPQLPDQLKALEEVIVKTQARLVVLDPLAAFVRAGLALSNEQVRSLLAKLAQLARRCGCAMLLIRHLAKHGVGAAQFRGLGAMAFINVCRLTWFAAEDPRDRSRCVLASCKTNLAAAPPSLAYRVSRAGVGPVAQACAAPGDGDLAAVPAPGGGLEWLAEIACTADELVQRGQRRLDLKRARARRFLETYLAKHGPCLSSNLKRVARRRKISEPTLHRARRDLNIEIDRVAGKTSVLVFWRLAHQKVPDYLRRPVRHDLDPWLEKLTSK